MRSQVHKFSDRNAKNKSFRESYYDLNITTHLHLIVRSIIFYICSNMINIEFYCSVLFQATMPIQRWVVKSIMCVYSIRLEAPCIQLHSYAQMELFFNNKYSTVIGGMNLIMI